MKIITFKSTPENWNKEYLGLKPNTVRKKDKDDERFEILDSCIDGEIFQVFIKILNTVTQESFTRRVVDVTKFEDFYIISWRHE